MIEKKYFSGFLNGDDAPEFVAETEYVNAINIRLGSSDGGKTGWIENIKSNTLITNTLPSGTNTCIGSCIDEDEQSIIWFNKNSNGNHGIYVYLSSGVVKTVLLNIQVEGGLSFSNQIQAGVVNDQLFWVDGVNEFRRINYKAAIKSNDNSFSYKYAYPSGSNGIKQSLITVIRRPPQYALEIEKVSDNTVVTNFIKDESFKFSYFYTYRDGEQSVLAPWSVLGKYNFDADTAALKNAYDLKVSFSESIDFDVQKVSLVFKNESTNKSFIVKEWNKDVSTENTNINNHNSKSTKLTFRFYNNQNGLALDDAFSVKQYDNIPIYPKAFESARNRNFLGNYLQGYDSPKTTPLTASPSAQASSTIYGNWYRMKYYLDYQGTKQLVEVILIDIWGIASPGWYEAGSSLVPNPINPTSVPPYNSSISWSSIQSRFRGQYSIDVMNYFGIDGIDTVFDSLIFEGDPNNPVEITGATATASVNTAIIKSDASYQLGIVFYDFARRRCGVVTNDACRVITPDRNKDNINDRTGINWSIPGTQSPALLQEQIPSWATHYSIVSTKCLRTSYFIQTLVKEIFYVDRGTDGKINYSTKNGTYTNTRAGIAINLEYLTSYNLGYVFSEGDICKIYTATGVFPVSIIEQEGNYIVCQNVNAGALNASPATEKIEIYSPKKQSSNEFYYEQGDVYSINSAGTSNRSYSVLSGRISGDVYVVSRGSGVATYTVEAMSPNDKYYTNWYTNAGSPNLVTSLGQQNKVNGIAYSNKYIPGTNTNGLCTFDALDESEVPLECGPINKLVLTSKTQDEGTVMLSICSYETASIYLGEAQLVSNQGNSFIARADGVIGTINILKGSFGTLHPESVASFRGMLFWFDAFNGKVIQYSSNGLFPISDYKMSTVFNQIGKKYLGQNAYFFGGIDPYHEEYLLSSSFTTGAPSYGNFSTTSIANKVNAYDASPFTYAFKIGADKWVGKYDYLPENFVYLGSKLFTFKNGGLYEHGASGYNNFYGTQYDSVLSFVSNSNPSAVKIYNNISLESNKAPANTIIYTTHPFEKVSTLISSDYKNKEGLFYAPIFRDRLSPNVLGSAELKEVSGDRMFGTTMHIQMNFSGSSKLELRFVNINYNPSKGHKNIQS